MNSRKYFTSENLPGEKRDAYQTLGGFVFRQMGRIPAVADAFDWNGLRLEVVDMDGKRIDKVARSQGCRKASTQRIAAAPKTGWSGVRRPPE